jgi:hypothetical protein
MAMSSSQKWFYTIYYNNEDGSTAPEKWAAKELARVLTKIVGQNSKFSNLTNIPSKIIIVGRGATAKKYFPDVNFDALDSEEVILKSSGNKLLISGGDPRGQFTL